MAPFLYALTSSNINRFSKLFHCQYQEKICNNTITKDPTTPQVCRYTNNIGLYLMKLRCYFWATRYSMQPQKPEMAIMTAKLEDYFIFGSIAATRYISTKISMFPKANLPKLSTCSPRHVFLHRKHEHIDHQET